MAEPEYTLNNDWPETKVRLSIMEKYLDPQTHLQFNRCGLSEGWRCLEIGPGAGSILKYLSHRVGKSGHVDAIDLNLSLLSSINLKNVTLKQADITKESLPKEEYDLVHARGVFVHIPKQSRADAFDSIYKSLKPGGVLVLEEPDFITDMPDPGADSEDVFLYQKALDALRIVQCERGMSFELGRYLYRNLFDLGLINISVEGKSHVVPGGSDYALFFKLTYQQLKLAILSSGLLSEKDYEQFLLLCDKPDFALITCTVMSAHAYKPNY